ncbi:MAG TPA: hypothetical protein VGF97_11140 [Rhizomicrobium sp.]
MSKAVLHLGFHKTGTTFLQTATRDWLGQNRNGRRLFYSSQRARDSGWAEFRERSYLTLRDRIARAERRSMPNSVAGVLRLVDELGIRREFGELCDYLVRPGHDLIHSDENSLGRVIGQFARDGSTVAPFYPNGDCISAVFACAAAFAYDEIDIVLSLRRFDEMLTSSLKSILKLGRKLPSLKLIPEALSDIGERVLAIVLGIAGLDFVSNVHVFDYELLRRDPPQYASRFFSIIGEEIGTPDCARDRVNSSMNDEEALKRLAGKAGVDLRRLASATTIGDLLAEGVLGNFSKQYQSVVGAISAVGDPKIRYIA